MALTASGREWGPVCRIVIRTVLVRLEYGVDRAVNRVLFRDVSPYEPSTSPSALRGPRDGMLEVPIIVHRGPSRVFDLGEAGQHRMAYQALAQEGTPRVQEALLNETLLARNGTDYPDRALPRPVGGALPRSGRVTASRSSTRPLNHRDEPHHPSASCTRLGSDHPPLNPGYSPSV
jgi:hypothetical protein